MHIRLVAPVVAAALFVVACSSSGATGSAPASAPVADPTAAAGVSASPAATRIDVILTDTLRMEPSSMTVPAGVPVTFVITNAGALEHEFYLGDEAAQTAHEAEMQAGAMNHDDPEGIAVKPGESRELTYTFDEPGETLAGCHVAGHYLGGMKATITVVS